jgi:dihydroorotase
MPMSRLATDGHVVTYDLILKGGRLFDPAQKLDAVSDIAFAGGKIAAIGNDLPPGNAEVRDASGKYVAPGFIDLHTHVYWGGTSLGVDATALASTGGITTFVDAGSAGPGNYKGFLKHVIEPSEPRILAYLHVSFAGIFAFSRRIMVGESGDMRLISPIDAIEVAQAHPDTIIGIKVRLGRFASGNSGIAPLDLALDVAERTGLPIMAHIDEPPPSYEEVLARLRPGDVLTHCFRPAPNTPIGADGLPKQAVLDARARGVLFDIGHGMGSFSFNVARAMLGAGFAPDTISSDVHDLNVSGPVFDQATTLSKFLALGMPLTEVIAATTASPAAAIRRPELGTLSVGAVADATLFTIEDGHFELTDSVGEVVAAKNRIKSEAVVLHGRYRQMG